HAGEVDEARAVAAEALELAHRTGRRFAALWATTALGLLELSLGSDKALAETLAYSIELVEQDGVIEPSSRPFLADAIEAFIHLAARERADRLPTAPEERADPLQRPSSPVAAARCRALTRAARGEHAAALAGLEQALAATPDVPEPLELARA